MTRGGPGSTVVEGDVATRAAPADDARRRPAPDRRRILGIRGLEPSERFLGVMPVDWRFELTRWPGVRRLLRSRWTSFTLEMLGFLIFAPALLAGVVGTPVGNANLLIVVVWIFWWALLMLVMVPFGSRIWCAMCPLPAIGEWLQRGTVVERARGKPRGLGLKWPKALRNMWPVNAVFLGLAVFSGILTTRPWATALMLGSIIVAATVLALVYEKRTFCRYLCPVGGFLGLYSNFAALEVRHKDFAVCQAHRDKECIVGSTGGYGCPWMESPTTLSRNTYCGLCFECFRSCSKDNMGLYLRPFGTDLLVDRHRGLDESWKAFIMLGAAAAYSATMMGPWGRLKDAANIQTVGSFLLYAGGLVVALTAALPALFALFALASARLAGARQRFRELFVNFSYTLVPLGLLAWIAFSFAIVLPNGSYVLRVVSDPFGWGWNLFGTAGLAWTPVLTGWLPWLQLAALLFGFAYSLDVGWKVARQTLSDRARAARALLPQVAFLGLATAGFVWLFLG